MRHVVARAPAQSSFTVVLPTDPVIPTTMSGSRSRATAPTVSSAAAVSATVIAVAPGTCGPAVRYAGAPAATAAARWACPSVRSTSGTKSWPATSVRVSVLTPSVVTSGPWRVPFRVAAS